VWVIYIHTPPHLTTTVSEPVMTGVERVSEMTDLASIVKRYMINTENRRLEEENAVSDDVYDKVSITSNKDDKAVVKAVFDIEHSKTMINHIQRLMAIDSMWSGVGGGVGVRGGGDSKDTADMPALVQARPSRFEIDRQRNRCLQMMFLDVM
jgi:hypothetical protein